MHLCTCVHLCSRPLTHTHVAFKPAIHDVQPVAWCGCVGVCLYARARAYAHMQVRDDDAQKSLYVDLKVVNLLIRVVAHCRRFQAREVLIWLCLVTLCVRRVRAVR